MASGINLIAIASQNNQAMIQYNKIILIDDETICNYVTSKILMKATIAHSIESFSNAKSALAQIENNSEPGEGELLNLILLDINMPDMNGWDFLVAFEKLPDHLVNQYSVMMLTSSIDTRDIEKSQSYKSVRKFISKPFSIDKIV